MKRVLVTGAAGIVGNGIRRYLRERYAQLVLTDVQPVGELAANETCVQGDLADAAFIDRVTQEVDGIVHLACRHGTGIGFEDTIDVNLRATHHLLDAAHRRGIGRFVYASSHHAVGFLKRGVPIDHRTAPRPDSYYGLSKVMGESMCALFTDRFDMRTLAIRIGNVDETVVDERRLHIWSSFRDLAQLVQIGLECESIRHEIVYGVSDCPEPFFDNSNAFRMGYKPQDRALDNLADASLHGAKASGDDVGSFVIGGMYAAAGFAGDLGYFRGGEGG